MTVVVQTKEVLGKHPFAVLLLLAGVYSAMGYLFDGVLPTVVAVVVLFGGSYAVGRNSTNSRNES